MLRKTQAKRTVRMGGLIQEDEEEPEEDGEGGTNKLAEGNEEEEGEGEENGKPATLAEGEEEEEDNGSIARRTDAADAQSAQLSEGAVTNAGTNAGKVLDGTASPIATKKPRGSITTGQPLKRASLLRPLDAVLLEKGGKLADPCSLSGSDARACHRQ